MRAGAGARSVGERVDRDRTIVGHVRHRVAADHGRCRRRAGAVDDRDRAAADHLMHARVHRCAGNRRAGSGRSGGRADGDRAAVGQRCRGIAADRHVDRGNGGTGANQRGGRADDRMPERFLKDAGPDRRSREDVIAARLGRRPDVDDARGVVRNHRRGAEAVGRLVNADTDRRVGRSIPDHRRRGRAETDGPGAGIRRSHRRDRQAAVVDQARQGEAAVRVRLLDDRRIVRAHLRGRISIGRRRVGDRARRDRDRAVVGDRRSGVAADRSRAGAGSRDRLPQSVADPGARVRG